MGCSSGWLGLWNPASAQAVRQPTSPQEAQRVWARETEYKQSAPGLVSESPLQGSTPDPPCPRHRAPKCRASLSAVFWSQEGGGKAQAEGCTGSSSLRGASLGSETISKVPCGHICGLWQGSEPQASPSPQVACCPARWEPEPQVVGW
jgi:hypothetical protein